MFGIDVMFVLFFFLQKFSAGHVNVRFFVSFKRCCGKFTAFNLMDDDLARGGVNFIWLGPTTVV